MTTMGQRESSDTFTTPEMHITSSISARYSPPSNALTYKYLTSLKPLPPQKLPQPNTRWAIVVILSLLLLSAQTADKAVIGHLS